VTLFNNDTLQTLKGIVFVALFAVAALEISELKALSAFAISPLIIGIVIGLFYAMTMRAHCPESLQPGILFSSKRLLRLGVVLYGFRLTFQEIGDVGALGIVSSLIIVTTTMVVGYFVGTKVLKMDRDTALLVSAGSAVCGAAAVLAAETVLKSKGYKSAIAVGTVVIFGTFSMFLYPTLHAMGLLPLDVKAYGIYIGSTVHEVAQVVAAGSAVVGATQTAVVVKMTRVMLLIPFLFIMGMMVNGQKETPKLTSLIPWFAVGFMGIVGLNSLTLLPENYVTSINTFDTFILTMAMTALGMNTQVDKFKTAGLKPLILASILFAWLAVTAFIVVTF